MNKIDFWQKKIVLPFSYHSIRLDDTFSYSGRVTYHLVDYISGTESLRHNPFELDQWHHESFQMS